MTFLLVFDVCKVSSPSCAFGVPYGSLTYPNCERKFSYIFMSALGPTQPSVQWVPGYYNIPVPGSVALTTHLYLVPRLKKEYNYICIPSQGLQGRLQGQLYMCTFVIMLCV